MTSTAFHAIMSQYGTSEKARPEMRHILSFLAILAFAAPALAGTKALYIDPRHDRRLEIEIADNGDTRISPSFNSVRFIMKDGTLFLATPMKDGWKVARMTDFVAAMDEVRPHWMKGDPSISPSTELAIEKGGQRQVNGRMGTIYKISGLGQNGVRQTAEFVMSNDPALAPIGRALTSFIESMTHLMRIMSGTQPNDWLDKSRRVFAFGTLIDSPQLRLHSIETMPIDPQGIALPAEPLTADEIKAELQREKAVSR